MDLALRKKKFVRQFLAIESEEKIERLEAALAEELNTENATVTHTILGEPLSEKEYVKRIKDADADVAKGNFTTVEDLEKESENW